MRLYYSPSGYDLTCEMPQGMTPDRVVIEDSAKQEVLDESVSKASIHINELEYDLYTAYWMNDGSTIKVQVFDLAEFPYFTIKALKNEIEKSGIRLDSSITDEDIAQKREQVEDIFDNAADYSFCTKGYRQRLYGDGSRAYILEKAYAFEILSLSVNGSFYDASKCQIRGLGMLKFPEAIDDGSVIDIHYLHGSRTFTQDLTRFALLYAKSIIGSSSLDPRATGQTNEFGYMRFSVAGKDGATGIPEVDAFLGSNHNRGGQGLNRMFVL